VEIVDLHWTLEREEGMEGERDVEKKGNCNSWT